MTGLNGCHDMFLIKRKKNGGYNGAQVVRRVPMHFSDDCGKIMMTITLEMNFAMVVGLD